MAIRQYGITILILLTLGLVVYLMANRSTVPNDVLGLTIGMDKVDAGKHLQDIAEFQRSEGTSQQVWKLKDDPNFRVVAVGYNRENKVRYVTAFVDKDQAKERIPFSGVGDLETAKAEIMEPHYRYIWEVPPVGGSEAYDVNVYGDNAEFVTIYTIVERPKPGETGETNEDAD